MRPRNAVEAAVLQTRGLRGEMGYRLGEDIPDIDPDGYIIDPEHRAESDDPYDPLALMGPTPIEGMPTPVALGLAPPTKPSEPLPDEDEAPVPTQRPRRSLPPSVAAPAPAAPRVVPKLDPRAHGFVAVDFSRNVIVTTQGELALSEASVAKLRTEVFRVYKKELLAGLAASEKALETASE